MKHYHFLVPALLMCLGIASCMKQEPSREEEFDIRDVNGLFIVNEGSFGSGTASLSYYDVKTGEVENDVFYRANGFPLGDVAQSMTVYGDRGWIVVNNSKVIFSIGLSDMKEKGRITGFTSPRHIQFVSGEKAYVTDLYDTRITIVNPQTYEITGYVGTGCSTEQMIISEGFMYVNSWSSGTEILKIDLASDTVVDRLEVGIQPCSMVLDAEERLWVLVDGGGWEGNPAGYEKPSIVRVDLQTFEVEKEFSFSEYVSVSDLAVSGDGRTVYWLAAGLWAMDADAQELPEAPLVDQETGMTFYSLTVSPSDGDIYMSDAIDYSQDGKVYRYTSDGQQKEVFAVGICPGAFCWNTVEE